MKLLEPGNAAMCHKTSRSSSLSAFWNPDMIAAECNVGRCTGMAAQCNRQLILKDARHDLMWTDTMVWYGLIMILIIVWSGHSCFILTCLWRDRQRVCSFDFEHSFDFWTQLFQMAIASGECSRMLHTFLQEPFINHSEYGLEAETRDETDKVRSNAFSLLFRPSYIFTVDQRFCSSMISTYCDSLKCLFRQCQWKTDETEIHKLHLKILKILKILKSAPDELETSWNHHGEANKEFDRWSDDEAPQAWTKCCPLQQKQWVKTKSNWH